MSKNSISIEASKALVSEVIGDLEKYPTWSTGIKSVQVDELDGSGHPIKTTSSIDAGVMKDRVTLNYDWSKAPTEISFELERSEEHTSELQSH